MGMILELAGVGSYGSFGKELFICFPSPWLFFLWFTSVAENYLFKMCNMFLFSEDLSMFDPVNHVATLW